MIEPYWLVMQIKNVNTLHMLEKKIFWCNQSGILLSIISGAIKIELEKRRSKNGDPKNGDPKNEKG